MPEFTAEHPREPVEVLSIKGLSLPRVYDPGHILTEDEAKFMNARLISIINNAYSGDLRREMEKMDAERAEAHKKGEWKGAMTDKPRNWKEGQAKLRHERPAWATVEDVRDDEGKPWSHQERLESKFAAYKVGGLNTRPATEKDPLEKTAREIAVRETKDALVAKGQKVKTWMDTKDEEFGSAFNKLVHVRLNGKHRERIYALAKAQTESRPEDDEEFVIPEALQEAKEAA